jgi:hypothetical protein
MDNHEIIQTKNGSIYEFNKYMPKLPITNKNIKQIYVGINHFIIYENDGNVLVCGSNDYGQLGLGHLKNIYHPTLLINDKDIKNITCGQHHTIIHKNNGEIYGCGSNHSKQLSFGQNEKMDVYLTLILLTKNDNINKIISSRNGTILLYNDGTIFICGVFNNIFGQFKFNSNDHDLYMCKNPLQLNFNTNDINNIYSVCRDIFIHKKNGDLVNIIDPNIILFNDNCICNIICCFNYFIVQNIHNEIYYMDYNNIKFKFLFKDENIRTISSKIYELIIYKTNGQLLKIHYDDIKKITPHNYNNFYKEIMKDETIISINGKSTYLEWTPNNHKLMMPHVKKSIYYLLLINVKYNKTINIKIPKFVLYEIFKFVAMI